MTRYSVQSRDQLFVKGYGFLSFAKTMGKYFGKNISKNLNSKYSQKLHDSTWSNNLLKKNRKLLMI